MGIFSVELTVRNRDTLVGETVSAVVDTAATISVMPASVLNRLGIEPVRTRRFRLANDETVEYRTGMALFETSGRDGEASVAFGLEGRYLMGATTIEELAFIVDPIRKRLIAEDMMLLSNGLDNGGDA